jgi:hypothetical protein
MNSFNGYHAEWNLGCPGGWEYQRMAQERGKLCWNRIKKYADIQINLDFEHPVLNPVPLFMDMLLRAHRIRFQNEKPFILLVAEEDTLDKVTENINLVAALNRMDGVDAALTCPQALEIKGGEVCLHGRKATVIFLDINSDVLLNIMPQHDLGALMEGIRKGIAINPRGMEPVGDKGVFEVVTGEMSTQLASTTVKSTPWTRLFYPRKTTGPRGESINDLVQWVRQHWREIILKPVHGYSGKGIIVGSQSESPEEDAQWALKQESYIVQSMVPENLWAEEYPWIDREEKRVGLKRWQTDFRCFINDQGLIGFLARFGGIPTNVGAGGGGQSVALLKTGISVNQAVDQINRAIVDLGYATVSEIQDEIDEKGLELGHTYLEGPTPTTLRPRIITPGQLVALQKYGANLWNDALKIEKMWREGILDHVVLMGDDEARIARMQPWGGSPALMASDGLFSFGADLLNSE